MNCILLVRVSTLSQDYEAQKNDLIQYSKQLGYSDYHLIENKESAIKLSEEERSGLNDMKEWVETHPDYRTVIVWEISRLARSEKVLHSVKDYFLENKIQLLIYDKKYKLLNDDGTENQETSLLFSLYAYFAESEMKIKKERFRRSKRLNAEQGKFNGGGVKYGYYVDENNYLKPDPVDSQVVKEIFLKYATGNYSIYTLARDFKLRGINLPPRSIGHILEFSGYSGRSDYDDRRNSHRNYIPIVTKELFEKCQRIREDSTKSHHRTKHYYLGAQLITCPECGLHYTYGSTVYSCVGFSRLHTCSYNLSLNSKRIDILLWYLTSQNHKQYLSVDKDVKMETLFQEIKSLLKKTLIVQNEINKINKKFDRVNSLYVNLKITDLKYQEMESDIKGEIKVKQDELDLLDSMIETRQTMLQSIEDNNLQQSINPNITLKEMRGLVREYILNVSPSFEFGNKKRVQLDITYKKFKNQKCTTVTETYIYLPYSKKHRFEFSSEPIDELIEAEIGDTMDTIIDDFRN